MLCTNCDNKETLSSKLSVVPFTDCGLDNVVLKNVRVYDCPKCGETYFEFGDLEKLHQRIAEILIGKPELEPKEAKFLRKHLGYSGAMYARHLGIKPETVSRYENGHMKIPRHYQITLKAMISSRLPDRQYDVHDELLREGTCFKRMEFWFTDEGGWQYKLAC